MSRCDEFIRLLTSRRSVRRFKGEKVDHQALEKILDAGASAPSPHNTQPWLFIVITDKSVKERLARRMSDAYLQELNRFGVRDPEALAEKAYKRTLAAPVLILLCLDMRKLTPRSPGSKMFEEWVMGTQSLAAAAENMLLAAHCLGLSGCWRAAPLFCKDAVREALELPGYVEPQALLEIGYPAQNPKPINKKSWREITITM